MRKIVIGDAALLEASYIARMLRNIMGRKRGNSDLVDWRQTAVDARNEELAKREAQAGTLISSEELFNVIFNNALIEKIQVKFKLPTIYWTAPLRQ